jgi:hypothetical protein
VIASSTTILNCSPEQAWQELQTSRLLDYIAAPLVRFVPVQVPALPTIWEERSYLVELRLFDRISLGKQWIVITRQIVETTPGQQRYELRDNGHGDLIATWDHRIFVHEPADGCTNYTNQVEVKPRLLTPFVWAFASMFYRYRQHRWRQLLKRNFAYPPTTARI